MLVPDWAMIGVAGLAYRPVGPHSTHYYNPEPGTIRSAGCRRISMRMLHPGWSQRVRVAGVSYLAGSSGWFVKTGPQPEEEIDTNLIEAYPESECLPLGPGVHQ